MNFLFIENRYKTYFWDELASHLSSMGHTISWIIQNPSFLPKTGTTHKLSFPRKTQPIVENNDINLQSVRAADRYINYFGGNDDHYPHYLTQIQKIFCIEQPDIVIGEATLFHELITIEYCKSINIPFLHPSMPGYPGGRYSIYAANTKITVGVNHEVPSEEFCIAMAEAIRKREKIPDYMVPPSSSDPLRKYPLIGSPKDRLRSIKNFIEGERYNTPSPWTKLVLQYKLRKRLVSWATISKKYQLIDSSTKKILYPLQMQPESNLDVWGQNHRNQAKLITEIASNLPPGWVLLVKSNPKAKYEMCDELITILRTQPNVIPIPLEVGMAKVLSDIDLVCTVTGTIAAECVLSNIPVAQLGPGITEGITGSLQLSSMSQLMGVIEKIESNQFELADMSEKIKLIQKFYSTTFPGNVSDPSSMPVVMDKKNIARIGDNLITITRKTLNK